MNGKSNLNSLRVSIFREKLAESDLSRYEIYASSATKKSVREIAKIENISPGVAAEALLQYAINAYTQEASLLSSNSQSMLAIGSASATSAVNSRVFEASSMMASQEAAGLNGLTNSVMGSLSSYSQRPPSDYQTSEKPEVTSQADLISKLIKKAHVPDKKGS